MNMLKTSSFELSIYDKGDPGASKVAIVLPGRLDSKDYIHITTLVDCLAELGYYAVSFDPPGTWESPGDIDDYTTSTYIKVVNEVIEQLGNKPTLLLGHSRGGSVAMLASGNSSVSGVVAIMASYGPATAAKNEAILAGYQIAWRDLPPGSSRTIEQKESKLPIAYFEDAKRYNPSEVLRKFNKPKLVVYGDGDVFSSCKIVEDVYETLRNPKTIKKVHCVHDYRLYPEVIQEVNAAVIQFLQSLE